MKTYSLFSILKKISIDLLKRQRWYSALESILKKEERLKIFLECGQ